MGQNFGTARTFDRSQAESIVRASKGELVRMPCSNKLRAIDFVASDPVSLYIYDLADGSDECKDDVIRFMQQIMEYKEKNKISGKKPSEDKK
jgi:hypothetical protein